MTSHWTPRPADTRVSGRMLRRMALPIAAVGLALLAAGVYGAWRVHRLQERGAGMFTGNVASIRAGEDLETIASEWRYRLKRYSITENRRHLARIRRTHPEARRGVDEAVRLAKSPREQQLADRIRDGVGRFLRDFGQLDEALSATDRASGVPPQVGDPLGKLDSPPLDADEAAQLVSTLADDVIPHRILAFTRKYVELNEEELARNSDRNRSTANRLMFGLILLGASGGLATAFAGYAIAQRVGRTILQLTLPIRDAAGKLDEVVEPISVAANPGFDDLGSVLHTVSERVSTVVERLQASEREMLRAEQLAALGQMAAGLAHELRNPLTAVKTIVQLANDPHELTQRDLQVLQDEIRRLEQSIQTFLDFARPPQPEKRRMELGEVVRQTVSLMERRAERLRVSLTTTISAEPIEVVADCAQLRQVLLNLVLNALDALPQGGMVQLEAGIAGRERSRETTSEIGCDEVGRSAVEGGEGAASARRDLPRWAFIRVSDTGSGLPARLGSRIFEPFVSTKETGSGLGLSICRRIVEAHGGRIEAAAGDGGGSVFTVHIPMTDAFGPRRDSDESANSNAIPAGNNGVRERSQSRTTASAVGDLRSSTGDHHLHDLHDQYHR